MKEEMLARLVAEADAEGHDLVRLRSIVEEASASGASRALKALGLEDEAAKDDMRELRGLLGAWRDAKSATFKSLVHWVARMLVALALMGLAAKFGIGDLIAKEVMG